MFRTRSEPWWRRIRLAIPLAAMGIIFNAGLIATPGYWSHDEIEWGTRASVESLGQIDWASPLWLSAFHYRPLSIDVWLFAAYFFFDAPQAMHAFMVLFHLLNALLFYLLLRDFGIEKAKAVVAFLIFCAFPTATVAVGWVGTIPDLTALCFALCALWLMAIRPRLQGASQAHKALYYSAFSGVCVLGLMSKEHFIVLPAVIFVIGFLLPAKRALDLVVLSGVLCVSFLGIRWGALVAAPAQEYSTSVTNVPANLFLYFIYPFVWTSVEAHTLFDATAAGTIAVGALLHLTLVVLLFICAGYRAGIGYVLLFLASMSAMLLLERRYAHYLYPATPVFALSIAWLLTSTRPRVALASAGVLLIALAHSVVLQQCYFEAGVVQSRFYTSLYSILRALGPEGGMQRGRRVVVLESPPIGHIVRRAVRHLSRLREIHIQEDQITAISNIGSAPADAIVLEALPSGHVVLPALCSWGGSRACGIK